MEDFNQNLNNQTPPAQQPQPQPMPSYAPPADSFYPYENKGPSLPVIILIIVAVILLISNIYFGVEYFSTKGTLTKSQANNSKIVAFENLFIGKVLKTQGAVSYQDRLNLQSAVVDINDNTILADWNTFLASSTETDAQQSVLILLQDFTNKIDK